VKKKTTNPQFASSPPENRGSKKERRGAAGRKGSGGVVRVDLPANLAATGREQEGEESKKSQFKRYPVQTGLRGSRTGRKRGKKKLRTRSIINAQHVLRERGGCENRQKDVNASGGEWENRSCKASKTGKERKRPERVYERVGNLRTASR